MVFDLGFLPSVELTLFFYVPRNGLKSRHRRIHLRILIRLFVRGRLGANIKSNSGKIVVLDPAVGKLLGQSFPSGTADAVRRSDCMGQCSSDRLGNRDRHRYRRTGHVEHFGNLCLRAKATIEQFLSEEGTLDVTQVTSTSIL